MNLDRDSEFDVNKKRAILLLRSVMVISLSYLVLFTDTQASANGAAYIAVLIVSNVTLLFVPTETFSRRHFSKALFLFDTAAVLIGLYFTVGFSQDFLVVYFFTMFLTAVVETVGQIAVGAILISTFYGLWLWMTAGQALGPGEWLRLPFFFIIAVFYAYMTEEVKRERQRRLQAERESEHLRFLLALGEAFARQGANHDWTGRVRSVIQSAFPRLVSEVLPAAPAALRGGAWVPFVAHGTTFGGILVTTRDGAPLRPDEVDFCSVAAFVAANGLYSAGQDDANRDATRLKEEFLSHLSHELRTPLHGLLGYIDLLDSAVDSEGSSLVQESLGRLRANAGRLQTVIEELLWFAELRAGHRPAISEAIDLRALFAEYAETVALQLTGRPIRFECSADPHLPLLRSDSRKLRQIISGLLSNAVKFTTEGHIRLTAGCVNGWLEITVQDTGVGIDPKHFKLIFEEFRQVDGSLTRRADGLGLGLALVQELTQVLGGRITVESAAGCGSTFRVYLPLPETSRSELRDDHAAAPQLNLAGSYVQ